MLIKNANYSYFQNTLWQLKAGFPFLRVKPIGKSVVGRSIYAMEIGREAAPLTLMTGTYLGTDGITGPLLLQWTRQLLTAVEEQSDFYGVPAGKFLQNQRIGVVPFVNPDGREICVEGAHCAGEDSGKVKRLTGGDTKKWQANARGVDLTANFSEGFSARQAKAKQKGVFGPSTAGYGGKAPFSEPETYGLNQYCQKENLKKGVALYPGKGCVYWRGRGVPPQNEKAGEVIAVTAGYQLEASAGTASYSGFRNECIGRFHVPAFDITVPCKDNETVSRSTYLQVAEALTVACLL